MEREFRWEDPDAQTVYDYGCLERDLRRLEDCYPGLEIGVAGQSVLGQNLYYLRLGTGPHQVFYNAAHHANEWLTGMLLMRFAAAAAAARAAGGRIGGYPAAQLWNQSSLYLMPLVNPDGADLLAGTVSPERFEKQLGVSGAADRLPLERIWKANIRGVDLNLNYPAGWETAKAYERAQGISGPAPSDYGGPAPLSEPETAAVAAFTRQHNFRLVLALHSQGRVIYWQYADQTPPGASSIAQALAAASGYGLEANPSDASHAGYKDWFIQEFGRPGFTVEVGTGQNPLPVSDLAAIYREILPLLVLAALL